MTLSGLLYIGAIVVFILTAILLGLTDSLNVRDGLALTCVGLAALAAAAVPWWTRP